MALIVTAGSTTVETHVGGGRARVDFYRGQTLPDDLTDEDRERVLRLGDAREVDDAPAVPEFDPAASLGQATIDAIVAWIDADENVDVRRARAQQALDAETAEKGKNRTTLIERLNAILALAA